MAYSSTNPPAEVFPRLGGLSAESTSVYSRAMQIYTYKTSDNSTNVMEAAYFSNGKALGMKNGDILFALCASTQSATGHVFVTGALVTTGTTGGFNLSTGGTITSSYS